MNFSLVGGSLAATAALFLAVLAYPVRTAIAAVSFLFGAGLATPCLGVDQVALNTTQVNLATYGLVAQNSKVKEELWCRAGLIGEPAVDDYPFADGFKGTVQMGETPNRSKLQKAILEITDTRKVRGTTINIPLLAGLGGEGATGENTRNGTEGKIKSGNMTVTIGKQFFAAALKQNVIDETVLADSWSPTVNHGLRALHARKKNGSVIGRMMVAANFRVSTFTGTSGANLMYPTGTSRATLKSANVFDTTTLVRAGNKLPGMGANPMDTTMDKGGSLGELFMFLSTQQNLVNLESETAYNSRQDYAFMGKGDESPIFKGGFTRYRGHGIYRWINRDHANEYSIGSWLTPKAKLGLAITGATTGTEVHGGGAVYATMASADEVLIQWFQDFSNAPYTFYGGVSNAGATTTTTRHIMIINSDGSGWAIYSYTVNDGNKITITAHVDLSGDLNTLDHPVGSEIYECNILGTCLGRTLGFGAQAVAAGIGTINGNAADPQYGKRTVEKRDYENDIGVGLDGVWGCAAVKRAVDSAYPNFLVIEHAITPEGAPTIS